MFHGSYRSNSWTSSTVRDRKGLMKIQMTNIGTEEARRCQATLRVHIGTIEVDLATVVMYSLDYLKYSMFKNSKSRRVSYHGARDLVAVFLAFLF